MRVFDSSPSSIRSVIELLEAGQVVALPTETVYGLAADALNTEAVARIFSLKGRPSYNPLIVHVSGKAIVHRYAEVNDAATILMAHFWPGPLTVVMRKTALIPDSVSAGLKTVGIRCPNQPTMLEILSKLDRPLAAPSANPSNYISPTRVEHVVKGLGGSLKYALDGGPCKKGVESTIVDVTCPDSIRLLRPGPILPSAIESILNREVIVTSPSGFSDRPTSPGQLPRHYSPRTPLVLGACVKEEPVARIHFSKDHPDGPSEEQSHYYLSDSNCPNEAESRLYALLQQLDSMNYPAIVVDSVPPGPEWDTIRDRLCRAATQTHL